MRPPEHFNLIMSFIQSQFPRLHVNMSDLCPNGQTKESLASALPFEHRLHVLYLFAGKLLELRVRVEDAGRSRGSVALVDVQPAGQFS